MAPRLGSVPASRCTRARELRKGNRAGAASTPRQRSRIGPSGRQPLPMFELHLCPFPPVHIVQMSDAVQGGDLDKQGRGAPLSQKADGLITYSSNAARADLLGALLAALRVPPAPGSGRAIRNGWPAGPEPPSPFHASLKAATSLEGILPPLPAWPFQQRRSGRWLEGGASARRAGAGVGTPRGWVGMGSCPLGPPRFAASRPLLALVDTSTQGPEAPRHYGTPKQLRRTLACRFAPTVQPTRTQAAAPRRASLSGPGRPPPRARPAPTDPDGRPPRKPCACSRPPLRTALAGATVATLLALAEPRQQRRASAPTQHNATCGARASD